MDNLLQIAAFVAFCVNAGLGVLVFAMNPQRRTNRYFLLTSFTLAAWLATLVCGAGARTRPMVIFWIRWATVASCFPPFAFDLLRMSIVDPDGRPKGRFSEAGIWLVLLIPVLIAVNLPALLIDVELMPSGFARPVYGWPQMVYVFYFLSALGLLTWRFWRDLRRTHGVQQAELEYTVLAFAVAAVVGIALGQLVPSLTSFTDAPQLMPLSVLLLDVVVAYGIATQRIMSVGVILRRCTAYVLLTAYLAVLYFAVFLGAHRLGGLFGAADDTLAHVLAALAVAFSMAPAHGRMQEFASRLFINVQSMDVRDRKSVV